MFKAFSGALMRLARQSVPENSPLDCFPLRGCKASGGRLLCADCKNVQWTFFKAETVTAKRPDEGLLERRWCRR